jgi:hypothetical protein
MKPGRVSFLASEPQTQEGALRKKIQTTLTVVAALGLAGTISSAAAANANATTQKGIEDCAVTYICLWTGTGYTGLRYIVDTQLPGQCVTLYAGYKSAYNRTTSATHLWQGVNCTTGKGAGGRLGPNEAIRDTGSTLYSVGAWP